MKAILKTYRQSPRKVRVVADLIRGKDVKRAAELLRFTNKRATSAIQKLLASAVANAKNSSGYDAANLIVKDISVDKGAVLKRSMPRARGRASQIKKRTSHIKIMLERNN